MERIDNSYQLRKYYFMLRNGIKEFLYALTHQKIKTKKFPEIINIETSIICNANCVTCPHKSIKRKINMEFETVKKIIDNASKYPVKEIHPFNYGEPFIYPQFIELLRYVRKKMPKTKLIVYSNGAAMTEEQMTTVIKERLLDKINFSLDAASPKTYKLIRGLDYKKTVEKINYFIALKRKYGSNLDISVSFVLTSGNEKELKLFKKYWKGKARLHIALDDGRSGRAFINRFSKMPCKSPFIRMFILTDGRVVCCEHDARGDMILGNINNNSLEEIWNSKEYRNLRMMHNSQNKKRVPLCKNCRARF